MAIEEKIPRIQIEINMGNEDYIIWNVVGAVRTLERAPEEADITLRVYEIHKTILRKRGVSEADLAIGDEFVEKAKKGYLI